MWERERVSGECVSVCGGEGEGGGYMSVCVCVYIRGMVSVHVCESQCVCMYLAYLHVVLRPIPNLSM